MRIRTIKPEFWQSFTMSSVSECAVILAVGLLNHSDDYGYFEADARLIKANIFPLREPSVSIHRALAELAGIGFIEVRLAKNHRLVGLVVNFHRHQKIDRKSRPSRAKEDFEQGAPAENFAKAEEAPQLPLDEHSASPQRVIATPSRVSPSGTGNREQGSEGMPSPRAGENPTPDQAQARSRENNAREIKRHMPEELVTPEFRAAWEKWVVHWCMTFNHGQPIPLATADAHLEICRRLRSTRALAAIDNAISRKLREPAEPFPQHANNGTSNGRSFKQAGSYAGITDK